MKNDAGIIPFGPLIRFCVYEHKIQSSKELSSCRMIVLKNQDGLIVSFTGLLLFVFYIRMIVDALLVDSVLLGQGFVSLIGDLLAK